MPDFSVHADDAEQRLDRFLRKLLPRATLGHVHKLLRAGRVTIGGERADGGRRLRAGEVVSVHADGELLAQLRAPRHGDASARRGAAARRAGAELAVVHDDAHLLVLDKPGGLAVHAGSGIDDDLLGRVARLLPSARDPDHGRPWTFRPAPAHRIDRGTSGLVVFGLSAAGLRGMAAAFRTGRVGKTYLALVRGRPPAARGEIDLPLAARSGADAARPKTVPYAEGKAARTRWRVQRRRGGLTLLEVEIEGGRTHQIRAHLAAVGLTIAGDRRYGDRGRAFADPHRIGLHAARLEFAHPVTAQHLALEAPCPADLNEMFERAGS